MEKLHIVEVGPRDGFQNVKELLSLEDKLETIRLLAQAGVEQMEIGSFVSPKAIPQMADMKELAETVVPLYRKKFRPIALVPNVRGAENAVACGIDTVTFVVSVSEKHNLANVRKTPTQSLESLLEIHQQFPQLHIRVDLATSFGCPYEGVIRKEQVRDLAMRACDLGVEELILCDTIGTAVPGQISEVVEAVRWDVDAKLGLHLHDTHGMGVANIYAGILCGVDTFETSVGGLGGCPFAPGAAGNTATEDLLYLTEKMGYQTGIDCKKYMEAVQYVKDHIFSGLTGRQLNACCSG